MTFADFDQFILTNLFYAFSFAVAMFTLTFAIKAYFTEDESKNIAKLLSGDIKHENWAASFLLFFEKLFGKSYFSLRGAIVSIVVSMVSVIVVWAIMGGNGFFERRLGFDLTIEATLLAALTINLIADYLSLAETRFLLRNMSRFPKVWMQILVLIVDFIASLAIIGVAIMIHKTWNPDLAGDDTVSEILGAFSLYSVMLYSTFVTSVWSWIFLISAWVIKITSRPSIKERFKIATMPIAALAIVNGLVGGIGLFGVAVLTETADGRVSLIDRAICTMFRDKTCLNVAQLAELEEDRIQLVAVACQNGLGGECVTRGFNIYLDEPETAVAYWEAGCAGGHGTACTNLGYMAENGLGREKDIPESIRLHTQSCDFGIALGCDNLGRVLTKKEYGLLDYETALSAFLKACDNSRWSSCTSAGRIHTQGHLGWPDHKKARDLFQLGCDNDNGWACGNLGDLYEEGRFGEADIETASTHFERGCDLEDGWSCGSIGDIFEDGRNGPVDLTSAKVYFRMGCDFENGWSCARLGTLLMGDGEDGITSIEKGCALGSNYACETFAGHLFEGKLVPQDQERALTLWDERCLSGDGWSCRELAVKYERADGSFTDPEVAYTYHDLACRLGEPWMCADAMYSLIDLHGAYEAPAPVQQVTESQDGEAPPVIVIGRNGTRTFENLGNTELRAVVQFAGKACTVDDVYLCADFPFIIEDVIAADRMVEITLPTVAAELCDQNVGWACHQLATQALAEVENFDNWDEIALLYDTACRRNYGDACAALGQLMTAGHPAPPNTTYDTFDLYLRGCNLTSAQSCLLATQEAETQAPELVEPLTQWACQELRHEGFLPYSFDWQPNCDAFSGEYMERFPYRN